MTDPLNNPERELEILRQRLEESTFIGGGVLEIAENTWAIHGVIPVDGDVLMAEFESYDAAILVLRQLRVESAPNGNQSEVALPRP